MGGGLLGPLLALRLLLGVWSFCRGHGVREVGGGAVHENGRIRRSACSRERRSRRRGGWRRRGSDASVACAGCGHATTRDVGDAVAGGDGEDGEEGGGEEKRGEPGMRARGQSASGGVVEINLDLRVSAITCALPAHALSALSAGGSALAARRAQLPAAGTRAAISRLAAFVAGSPAVRCAASPDELGSSTALRCHPEASCLSHPPTESRLLLVPLSSSPRPASCSPAQLLVSAPASDAARPRPRRARLADRTRAGRSPRADWWPRPLLVRGSPRPRQISRPCTVHALATRPPSHPRISPDRSRVHLSA